MSYKTREEWLNVAAQLVMKREAMTTERKYRVSCGLPSNRPFGVRRAIGQAWHENCTPDGVNEVFISPTISDPVQVVATLIHELGHIVAGLEAKHGPDFKKIVTAMGLEGRMTSTNLSDDALPWVEGIVAQLGDYPHGALSQLSRELDPTKTKQSTRLLKAACNEECGYTFRISKMQAERGLPVCPVCGEDMNVK